MAWQAAGASKRSDRPKSTIFRADSGPWPRNLKFSVLTSLWAMPWEWQQKSALSMWRAHMAASRSPKRPSSLILCPRLRPSSSSITSSSSDPSSKYSISLTMWGWSRATSASTSRWSITSCLGSDGMRIDFTARPILTRLSLHL